MRTMQTLSEWASGSAWMRPLTSGLALAWVLAAAVHGGAEESARQLQLPAEAVIRFAGTSTLHGFGGELPAQPFLLILSNGTWTASAEVQTGQMLTDNAKRDRRMHEMMRTNDFPRMRGAVLAAPIPGTAGTNVTLTLQIRGATNDLTGRISNWQETAESIQFHAKWELSLKQYGIKPPSVAGIMRVGDIVRLEADVKATKTQSTSSPPAVISP